MEIPSKRSVTDAEAKEALALLSSKKIFFGHQSVGVNILDGLAELSATLGSASLTVKETRDASGISGPGVYHAFVGKNTDPLGKLTDFESILRSGVGSVVDVAFLKFCYVDFDSRTDTEALFSAYKKTMADLRIEYPGLVLVHFTAPLTTEESGLKVTAKRLLGRSVGSDLYNAARERYNAKLRAEYGGRDPIFDIAQIESSFPDGRARTRKVGDGKAYYLRNEYSDDGGHLNQEGRTLVARNLAAFLRGLF